MCSRRFVTRHDKRIILAAKTKGVADASINRALAGHIGNVVKIQRGIRIIVIASRRQHASLNGKNACHEFHRAGRGDQVAHHAFNAAHWNLFGAFAKDNFHGARFNGIIFLGARAVRADVMNKRATIWTNGRWINIGLF